MNSSDKLQNNDEFGAADPKIYRSLIGRLLYLMHTHPDITFTVNLLSRFVSRPTRMHLGAAKHLLRYIAGTSNFGVRHTEVEDWKLRGFSDNDLEGGGVQLKTGGVLQAWFSILVQGLSNGAPRNKM